MAAHALTGLRQVRDDIDKLKKGASPVVVEQFRAHLKAACVLSCWTEDLPWNGYDILSAAVKEGTVKQIELRVISLLPWAEKEWNALGQPKTREEWHKAKFG